MREFKFRAWDTDENRWFPHDRGEWINVCHDGSVVYGYEDGEVFEGDGRFEIMFSTGLHDKHGKEIYEGDVVNFYRQGVFEYYPETWVGEIRREDGGTYMFVGKDHEDYSEYTILYPYNREMEVIGNIYETPA